MRPDEMTATGLFLDKMFDMQSIFNVIRVSISSLIVETKKDFTYFIVQQCFRKPPIT